MSPAKWNLLAFGGLLTMYGLLLGGGTILFYAATPIAMGSLLLGGLPSLLFSLLHFLIPLFSFLGGVAAWRSLVMALIVGLPLVPLSTAVLTLASSGEKYMAVPVPWPTAVALGTVGSTIDMLKVEALPYWTAFAAGVALGLLVRVASNALASRKSADA